MTPETAAVPASRAKKWFFLGLILVSLALVLLLFRGGRSYLIVENSQKSDVILVTAGSMQPGFDKGRELLHDGYGTVMIVDVPDIVIYGNSSLELARRYISQDPETAGQIRVCAIHPYALNRESSDVAPCLEELRPQRVLIVARAVETRHHLEMFSHDLPQYQWSVTHFRPEKRDRTSAGSKHQLARNLYLAWCRLVWWELYERWTKPEGSK